MLSNGGCFKYVVVQLGYNKPLKQTLWTDVLVYKMSMISVTTIVRKFCLHLLFHFSFFPFFAALFQSLIGIPLSTFLFTRTQILKLSSLCTFSSVITRILSSLVLSGILSSSWHPYLPNSTLTVKLHLSA